MYWTVPTLLTWARVLAIPLMVAVFYLPSLAMAERNLWATVLFVVIALTDWADGYLARRLQQTSAFGAFFDPVADKFLVCASMLILLDLERVHLVVALIIVVVKLRFRHCASGWRPLVRGAWLCTALAKSKPRCKWWRFHFCFFMAFGWNSSTRCAGERGSLNWPPL